MLHLKDNMQNIKEKIEKNISLKKYSDLINRIVKIEYKTIGAQYLIDYEELVNIGYQTVNLLSMNHDFEDMNESYISTAIKWAIRNELRSRYKWYGVRQNNAEEDVRSGEISYKSILSTDELFDSDKTYEIKDIRKNPEEKCEFSMLSASIKNAVMTLPKRERELIESKFFKEKKLNELSDEFSISPSRISRIIKAGLDKVKEELRRSEVI